MTMEPLDLSGGNEEKKLYQYQKESIEAIFERIDKYRNGYNLLFQLPTGGGKTVIFSELARKYIETTNKRVLILTHRIELCGQTSRMLDNLGVKNKIIDSKVKDLPEKKDFMCFVAMVETLNNRLNEEKIEMEDVGLLIIDEAHYNSFRKLFKYFSKQIILGVTATPLSSNVKLPLKDNYNELIVGESITSLIGQGYLAKASTYNYDVNLRSLKVGINGDYTVSSSEKLYSNFLMQEKLLYAYEEKSKGAKTLIFNNGINTSKAVYEMFLEEGYEIRHLDNTHSEKERAEILKWFKETPNAILTSVSILTTGFDEPTVESIILNRATKSLTLYYQMIGRGSRILKNKNSFDVIDLGNNFHRFGPWGSTNLDWQRIFKYPNYYLDGVISDEELESNFIYEMPEDIRVSFSNSTDVYFDVNKTYIQSIRNGESSKVVLKRSIEQHALICIENSEDVYDALALVKLLTDDIDFRIHRYSKCISKSTHNFLSWLKDDYKKKLRAYLRENFDEIFDGLPKL